MGRLLLPPLRRTPRPLRALTLAALVGVAAAAAQAQRADETPLADVIEVMVIDHQLVAFDALGGGQITEDLFLKEEVEWLGSRGIVGMALTNQRILAVAQRSAAWQELRYERTESLTDQVILGDRVGLLLTSNRAIGFNGLTGNLITERLGIRERVHARSVGLNVAVVVTDRRALGLSPEVGGFFATSIDLGETIENVSAKSNIASVTTNRRLLIFRSTTGTWEERRLQLQR